MKKDRFLMGILGGIGLLVIVAVILFFTRQNPLEYVTDNSPEGVVRNYILALQKEDYEYAYQYIRDDDGKPTLNDFKQTFIMEGRYPDDTSAQLGETTITGNDARISLTIIHYNNDPFSNTWDETNAAFLTQQNGTWKISNMPYPYWGWDWYEQAPKP